MKAENKIAMLDLGPSPEMKDKDGKKEKAKRKEVKKEQPVKRDAPMTAATLPSWKPPSKSEMAEDAVHSAMRESMRKWVSGEIDTKKHRETIKRGKKALSAIPSIRSGRY